MIRFANSLPVLAATGFWFGLTLSAGAQQAPATPELFPANAEAVQTISGQWDIAVPRNNLKCRIQLNVQTRAQKLPVGIPAACRKSFGSTGAAIQAWGLSKTGTILLFDGKGKSLVEFTRADTGVMKASISNIDFTLEPASGRYPSAERLAGINAAVTRLTMPAEDNPTTPIATAGRYQLLRGQAADTGCVLVLDRTQPGLISKSGQARLEKDCADKGLLTFDPASWIVERDRFFLYARKGHRFGFNIERDGRLVKDPPAGSPLSARKL
jgi:Protease inhibitor Inh